jgi:alkaline phosphatase D
MGLLRRRTIVLGGLAVAAAAVSAPRPRARTGGRYPFHLGVASGEPDSTSVLLWTRLARDLLAADGHGGMPDTDVAVEWQVSATESFAALVASGVELARQADAHSVHAIARGLRPDAEYFYRFRALGKMSTVARTRTTPAHPAPSDHHWPWPSSPARTASRATTPRTSGWPRSSPT